MILIFANCKNIKIQCFNRHINICIINNFIYYTQCTDQFFSFLSCVHNLRIWFCFQYIISILHSNNEIIS